eukprot:TRINITY_DN2947_c0_g1_i1.p1 TRINITY_DN2947_c0_g1~~TRINITY_DN2947_c0_g1_i1.p1  ORF type:complete len:248 (-),score=32.61 TRINITY_DN2947_c0_g1_i1:133-876(-)
MTPHPPPPPLQAERLQSHQNVPQTPYNSHSTYGNSVGDQASSRAHRRQPPQQQQSPQQHSQQQYQEETSLLTSNINSLSRRAHELESSAARLPAQHAKKAFWERRVAQLFDECQTYRNDLHIHLGAQNTKNTEEEERKELLQGAAEAGRGSLRLDHLTTEHDSLGRSNRLADEMEALGRNTIQALVDQRQKLEGVSRKLLEYTGLLQLQRKLIATIARRTTMDKVFVYGGMVFTLLFMAVLVYYLRW